jgi:hypothetical protein
MVENISKMNAMIFQITLSDLQQVSYDISKASHRPFPAVRILVFGKLKFQFRA